MRLGAVIPCKKGSKGVPDKNFRDMCGKPMYEWTLDAARQSGIFETIIISSNGGLDFDAPDEQPVFKIAPLLSQAIIHNNEEEIPDIDNSSLDALCKMYAEQYPDIDIWCLLQPTSPLRTAEDIQETFRRINAGFDSVISVESVGDKYWKVDNTVSIPYPLYNPKNRLMRQHPDTNKLYYENGAVYFFTREIIMSGSRIGGRVAFYEMPAERSVQIDTEYNWKFCEFMLRERGCQELL